MFNKDKIEALEAEIKSLWATVHYNREQVESLKEDLRALARYSGVDFETEKSRKLVKI